MSSGTENPFYKNSARITYLLITVSLEYKDIKENIDVLGKFFMFKQRKKEKDGSNFLNTTFSVCPM